MIANLESTENRKGVPLGSLWGRTQKPWSVIHSPWHNSQYDYFYITPLQRDVSFWLLSIFSSPLVLLVTLPYDATRTLKSTNKARTRKKRKKKISISLCTLVIVVARNFYTNLSRNTCHSTRSIGKSCLPRNLSIAYTRDEHSNRNSRTRYTQFLLRMRGCIVPIDGIRTKRTEYRFLG